MATKLEARIFTTLSGNASVAAIIGTVSAEGAVTEIGTDGAYTDTESDGALTGGASQARIYPLVMPQNSTLPAITYHRISGGQVYSMSGYSSLENPRIQIDVWGETYTSVKDLAEKVRDALDGETTTFRAILIGDQDGYEDDTKIYRVSMDYSCWHNTA